MTTFHPISQTTASPCLFTPIGIGDVQVRNRIVMGPRVSGYAAPNGLIGNTLYRYYMQRAHGGVGLMTTEPFLVIPPSPAHIGAHLGLYADAFMPFIRHLARAMHEAGARLVLTLDAPANIATYGTAQDMAFVVDQFVHAAWRAIKAGCDGIMLSSADGGLLHHLVSPLHNNRTDEYGTGLFGRLALPLAIIKNMRARVGTQAILGFRLLADEFTPGGIHIHNAQVIARHLSAAGVNLFDVTAKPGPGQRVASFPGWRIPLAHSIKSVVPNIPVIGSGMLGNPHLAESFVRDHSVDLIMLEHTLHQNPYWPQLAQIILTSDTPGNTASHTAPEQQATKAHQRTPLAHPQDNEPHQVIITHETLRCLLTPDY